MKKFGQLAVKSLAILLYTLCTSALASIYLLQNLTGHWWYAWILGAVFCLMQAFPAPCVSRYKTLKLRNTARGTALLRIFLTSTVLSITLGLLGIFGVLPCRERVVGPVWTWVIYFAIVLLVESIPFWNGILRIYITSTQLGIKWRVIGALTGLLPLVNLATLAILIYIAEEEIHFENQKLILDEARKEDRICQTKYPILLVHGIFFRDWKLLNYWGRIPDELEKNGAKIYYGNHQSAASVKECGEEIAGRIREICEETGCEKVNIIAHSKGGLDSRYAISKCGMAPYVATLTTVNTPHRGCEFADYLLDEKTGEKFQNSVAYAYNTALSKLGDPNPDFLAGVRDLTFKNCKAFNEEVLDSPQVYYQAVGSCIKKVITGGQFPLNFSVFLVNKFDGANDGLVGEKSFPWGDPAAYRFLKPTGLRGISHGDVIDTSRENLRGFDVREFYVQMVSDLREKGY